MQNILKKEERRRLKDYFLKDNRHSPLMRACEAVFSQRAAKLEGVKADAEDVLLLTAHVLDRVFQSSEYLEQQDVDDIWNSILMDVRGWEGSTVKDRMVIADTVFQIIKKLLCHHWDTYYCDDLYALFCTTADHESTLGNEGEKRRFQTRLSDFSEPLDNWVNNEYNGHLSDEMECVLKGKSAEVKTLRKSGRKPVDPASITASFSYLPHVDHRLERLQAFYGKLSNVFLIADQKVFLDLFRGTTTTEKIIWIREIKELKYLMSKLKKWIEIPESYTLWQMVCARFQIAQKVKKSIPDSLTADSLEIHDLKQTQFTSGSKLDTNHNELDKIIRILDPKTDYGTTLDDYLDDKESEHSEIEDTADALANGLNTDIRI